jgi:16S rRNA processing protein RimM
MDQLIKIGHLAAAHGVEGLLVLQHNLGRKSELSGVEAFFVETQEGRFLPYFISEVKARNAEESLLRVEGVDNREKALALLRKAVWLETPIAQKLADKSAPIALLGYTVMDGSKALGPVLEVIEQPAQILLRLEMEGKEVLAPLHEGTLEGIDHKKRIIRLSLPEGLLDIYLT